MPVIFQVSIGQGTNRFIYFIIPESLSDLASRSLGTGPICIEIGCCIGQGTKERDLKCMEFLLFGRSVCLQTIRR